MDSTTLHFSALYVFRYKTVTDRVNQDLKSIAVLQQFLSLAALKSCQVANVYPAAFKLKIANFFRAEKKKKKSILIPCGKSFIMFICKEFILGLQQ